MIRRVVEFSTIEHSIIHLALKNHWEFIQECIDESEDREVAKWEYAEELKITRRLLDELVA